MDLASCCNNKSHLSIDRFSVYCREAVPCSVRVTCIACPAAEIFSNLQITEINSTPVNVDLPAVGESSNSNESL